MQAIEPSAWNDGPISILRRGLPWLIFILAFGLGPLRTLEFLELMPDGEGDPRLNNYFLENIYLFLTGASDSLWHLGFYYPFPYVGGFSDNLFGASPIYLMARCLGGSPETAFQIWFLGAYPMNFASAYGVSRRWGLSRSASTICALVFSFSLPVTAFSGHAQLHYRFPVPWVIFGFHALLKQWEFPRLKLVAVGLALQFYLSIYIAFFLMLVLLSMGLWETRHLMALKAGVFPRLWYSVRRAVLSLKPRQLGALLGVMALMGILLFPYLKVSQIYQAKRHYAEIEQLLPTVESYFFTQVSPLWRWGMDPKALFSAPWEHELFIGAIPMLLLLLGGFQSLRRGAGSQSRCMLFVFIFLSFLSLKLGSFSLWRWVSPLPLASAIRGVTRIELVLLFPIGFLCGYAIDRIQGPMRGGMRAVVLVLLILEAVWVAPPTSSKEGWQHRREAKAAQLPQGLASDAILFFSQPEDREVSYFDEIDAMWVALERGLKTMNGYSGLQPQGLSDRYGTQCAEVVRRMLIGLERSGNSTEEAYLALMSRVQLMGFEGCRSAWWQHRPTRSERATAYPEDFFRTIVLEKKETRRTPSGLKVLLTISNHHSSEALRVGGEHPVALSWRWLDAEGSPIGGWDYREALPFDLEAGGKMDVAVQVSNRNDSPLARRLEFSLVHEHVEWGHDHGLERLRTDLPAVTD